ncbi:MAG: hypothetical protein JO033_00005 [Acidobacteriaceae bacterium]|nr:hypothetical protein [Acidobacteriaceae bacterium]MBV9498138.1 hypothetical protein [Acidobacteriaceae bacterium]
MRKRYLPTDEIDQKIRIAYQRQRQGDRSALALVRAEIGWSKSAVVRRGAALCLTRVKERCWSAEEERILEHWGHLTAAAIQRRLALAGYRRSCGAIQAKTGRLRIKRNLDGYSACALARAFGVDVHKVCYWIRRGLLHAERRGTARTFGQGGDMWWISLPAVRRFILRAPEEIDLARVEKFWFLDLLTGGKICR